MTFSLEVGSQAGRFQDQWRCLQAARLGTGLTQGSQMRLIACYTSARKQHAVSGGDTFQCNSTQKYVEVCIGVKSKIVYCV